MNGGWKIDMIEVWFDGACEPKNPGGTASCGWVIYRVEGGEKESITKGSRVVQRGGPLATNNYAEWCALGIALRWLLDNMKDECSSRHLVVIGDSQLVLKQLTGEWKCKADHLRRLRDRCRAILKELSFSEVEARWVPREQNAEADALSKQR